MLRRLLLVLVALGAGILASSLLRTERGGEAPPQPRRHGEARCSGRTRSGGRCSRPAEPGSDRCWQHR